jgi:uncharacterized ferredoxin-like protein
MSLSPPVIESRNGERDAILEVAKLMLIAARTAPKSGGIDDVLTIIVYGKKKNRVAEKMEEIAEQRKIKSFKRDAKNVRDSEAVILIGVRGDKSFGFKCGACGYESCKKFEETKKKLRQDFFGPTCVFKALDLGIALGSAAKTASILNVDNRIMYRVGTAALKLKLLPQATVIMGIPISAKGKNIYFDRK